MELSVIIPVFNAAKTIERCLNCLLFQLTENDEIIVIDDGSTDNSLEIIREIEKNNFNIRVYSQSNMGVGATRNKGIMYASKKWVTFVDADDYVDVNFKNTINKYEEDTVDVVLFEHYFEDISNTPNGSGSVLKIMDRDIRKCIESSLLNEIDGQFDLRSVWANVYKREFLLNNKIAFHIDVVIGEDMLFMLEVFDKASIIKFVKYPIYHYYFMNENSLTNRYKPTLYTDIQNFDKYIQDILDNENRVYYAYYKMNDIVLLMKYTFFNHENKNKYLLRRNEFIRVIRNGKYKLYYKLVCENKLQKRYGLSKRILFWCAQNEMIEALYLLYRLRYWRRSK